MHYYGEDNRYNKCTASAVSRLPWGVIQSRHTHEANFFSFSPSLHRPQPYRYHSACTDKAIRIESDPRKFPVLNKFSLLKYRLKYKSELDSGLNENILRNSVYKSEHFTWDPKWRQTYLYPYLQGPTSKLLIGTNCFQIGSSSSRKET